MAITHGRKPAVLSADIWTIVIEHLQDQERLRRSVSVTQASADARASSIGLSKTCHDLREAVASAGLRELSLYKLDVDRVAPHLDKPWTRTLLHNTERLVVNLPRGEHQHALALVSLMQPELLQVIGDLIGAGRLEQLLAASDVQRLRVLDIWEISCLTGTLLHLLQRSAATLQSITVSTFETLNIELSDDTAVPGLKSSKSFTLDAVTSSASEACFAQLLRHSPLDVLKAYDLSHSAVCEILRDSGRSLRELAIDIWHVGYLDLLLKLDWLDCEQLSSATANRPNLPRSVRDLRTCIAQQEDLHLLETWLADKAWCPKLERLTIYPHHNFGKEELDAAALTLLGVCALRSVTLRWSSGVPIVPVGLLSTSG